MAIERFQSEKVSEPPPETWSNCLVADNHVYIAGMTARGADFKPLAEMDEYEQAKVCLTKIRHLIEAAGGSMADIVRVNILVTPTDPSPMEPSGALWSMNNRLIALG